MPRKESRNSIGFDLTPAQKKALDKVRGSESTADFMRRLISQACEEQGIEFPTDMPAHGGKRDNK